jgi:hypothetical protein
MVGSMVHAVLEQIYRTAFKRYEIATLQFEDDVIPSADDILKLDYWNQVVPAMMRGYVNYWMAHDCKKFKIISYEEELDIVYRGFRLRGKVDLTSEEHDGIFIWDHKTSSRLTRDTVAGWDFRFQFMFYMWMKLKADPKCGVRGYYINAIKKPELRVKKNETFPSFAIRCYEDMISEPEKYFYRERYPITQGAMDHFEKTVVDHKINRIIAVLDPKTPPAVAALLIQDKNTDECQRYGQAPCPYIDLCRHGFEKMGALYTKRPVKHAELEEPTE